MRSTTTRHPVRVSAVVAGLLAMTLLTGCLDVTFHTRIDTDGSGTLTFDLTFSEQLTQLFGAFGEEFTSEDLVEEGDLDVPPEFADRIRITPRTDEVGVSVEIDFDDIDELNMLLADSSVDGPGSEAVVDRVEFEANDDRTRFSAVVGSTDVFDADDEFAMFGGDLTEPNVSFSVELPGNIVDHNADEVDGRTATWDLVAAAGTTIFAESGPGGATSSSLVLIIAGIVALIVLALVVLLVVRSRRSKSTPAPLTGGAPGAAPGGPPGQPPMPGFAAAGSAPTGGAPTAPGGWGATPSAPSGAPPMTTGLPPIPGAGPATAPQPEPAPTPPPPAEPAPAEPTPPGATPAGWYPDPGGSGRQRWWDGTAWTDQLS